MLKEVDAIPKHAPKHVAQESYVYATQVNDQEFSIRVIDTRGGVLAKRTLGPRLESSDVLSDAAWAPIVNSKGTRVFVVDVDNTIYALSLPDLKVQGKVRFPEAEITAIGAARNSTVLFVGFSDGGVKAVAVVAE
ncbi:MAG: hypothetical protein JWM11_1733 [Planctomycetaceae bacterium]|nr:hypothetical protein [Planctomycetaceae bacterium]